MHRWNFRSCLSKCTRREFYERSLRLQWDHSSVLEFSLIVSIWIESQCSIYFITLLVVKDQVFHGYLKELIVIFSGWKVIICCYTSLDIFNLHISHFKLPWTLTSKSFILAITKLLFGIDFKNIFISVNLHWCERYISIVLKIAPHSHHNDLARFSSWKFFQRSMNAAHLRKNLW